jgi:type IV secretion system coupling TraD/TrwB family protein
VRVRLGVLSTGRDDFILNPLDARCPRWSPWYELRDESHDADCEALAASLLPHPRDKHLVSTLFPCPEALLRFIGIVEFSTGSLKYLLACRKRLQ